MTSPQIMRMVRGLGLLILFAAFFWLVFATCGCGTTDTKTIYERVEVPKPYREYPTNVKPTPAELDLQYPHITSAEASADPTSTLVAIGQDMNLCVSSHEQCRVDYDALRILCIAPVEPTPTPE